MGNILVPRSADRQPAKQLGENIYLPFKRRLLTGIQFQLLAKPALERLATRLDETICLAVPSGKQMLIVDTVPSSRRNDLPTLIGLRYPLAPRLQNKRCVEVTDCKFPRRDTPLADFNSSDVSLVKTTLWNGQQIACGWICLIGKTARLPPKRIREILPILREEGVALSVLLKKLI